MYEKRDLEDDFAVHCQHSDGCTDGIWHGELHGTRTAFLREKCARPMVAFLLRQASPLGGCRAAPLGQRRVPQASLPAGLSFWDMFLLAYVK